MTYNVNDDQYPYTSVCCIQVRFGNDWYVGSGVLVGRNDVLTASHVIYQAGYGLADEVIVMPSFDANYYMANGTSDDREYLAADIEYYTEFDPDGDGFLQPGNNGDGLAGTELDIALITLSEAAGDAYGWMGIDYGFTSGTVNITGHPSARNNVSSNATGYVYADPTDWIFEIYSFGVSGGNSGGPVWYNTSQGGYVVGIVSTGGYATDVGAHEWISASIAANDHYMGTQQPDVGGVSKQDAQRLALLYEASFDRPADLPGLNFWIDEFGGGMSFTEVAQRFIDSAEFKSAFGQPWMLSDADFVDLLYENVLGRDGEPEGFNFWVGQLQSGAGREKVLLEFSVSPENYAGSPYVQTLFEDGAGNWHFA